MEFFYRRWTPKAVAHLDTRKIVRASLGTGDRIEAARKAVEFEERLEQLWAALLAGEGADACWGRFAGGGAALVDGRTLTPNELLRAWTAGGSWDLGAEQEIGALVAGLRADIAVLNADVLTARPETLREIDVVLTAAEGRVVYRAQPSTTGASATQV